MIPQVFNPEAASQLLQILESYCNSLYVQSSLGKNFCSDNEFRRLLFLI